MNIIIHQHILIFLLVSIGLICLPHVNHIPLPLFSFFCCLLLWRFIGIWKNNYLPNKWWLFLLTVFSIILLYTQHQGIIGRDAGTSLFITALGLKLLEIKQQRDLYLINYLAFVVAATQFLYQQRILMAVYILFVCSVLLATLVSINSHKPQTWAAFKTANNIIFQALPISIILFILFPRIEAPRWLLFTEQSSAQSGLSETLEPGSISRLGLSDELVFRVEFDGEVPPPIDRYWRGPIFSYTDGKKWTQPKDQTLQKKVNKLSYAGLPYQYTLLMEEQDKNWVFALDMPVSFPGSLKQNVLFQLINTDNRHERAEYQIISYTEYNTGAISKKALNDNLQLPAEASEKIKQLVEQLNGFDLPAEQFIQSLLDYFRNEKFYYTLTPPLMEQSPIDTFLFESRQGFCSHFATAFVYLMRVAGIPARVVGGYQGGELNKTGGFLTIRQANAHAWAEVWLENKGWTRFDPTAAVAPERVEQDVNIDLQIATGLVNFSRADVEGNKAVSWLKKARQLWGNVDYNWQRWVINYTHENQVDFLSSLGIKNITAMLYWLFGCISVMTGFLAWIILKKRGIKKDKELVLYQQFCKKMAKTGLTKVLGETALQYSERIKKERPELANKVEKITALFITIRYEKSSQKTGVLLLKKAVQDLRV